LLQENVKQLKMQKNKKCHMHTIKLAIAVHGLRTRNCTCLSQHNKIRLPMMTDKSRKLQLIQIFTKTR